MLKQASCLTVLLLVGGCASGGPPQILASTRTVDAQQAYALPPPGGPSIVSVIERSYNNAVQQEILLATSAHTPGQNVLRVQFFGPVRANLSGGDTLRDRQLGTTNIDRELRGTLPGVPMRRSPNYVQNRYGPFGFASGRSRSGDTCIYAWQRIRPPESQSRWFTGRGSIQVRLRLCDSRLTEEQLLAFMYGFTINAAFNDYSWNPYGEPAGAPENLGRPGANIYPAGPGMPPSTSLMPPPAPQPAAVQPQRRVRAPATPAVQTRPVRPAPIGPLVPPPPVSGTTPLTPAPIQMNPAIVPPPPTENAQ
ncbi:MAG: cellulose biosynthesis protein BcsN [Phyllobacterium sp.]|uniref:cellulose biosynthesis protein BcsN n=1 Tax=Phyllobacterium sp. TaxID=1871046 RepID=UPI0030F21E78